MNNHLNDERKVIFDVQNNALIKLLCKTFNELLSLLANIIWNAQKMKTLLWILKNWSLVGQIYVYGMEINSIIFFDKNIWNSFPLFLFHNNNEILKVL